MEPVEGELAGLLAAGERAAFHGRPVSGISPLQQAVEVARVAGRSAEATAAAWLLGVCLGCLRPVWQRAHRPGTSDHHAVRVGGARRLFAALAASTAASVHRQLGSHAVARTLDLRAEELAGESAEAAFDARLGLAADAVGLGEEGPAREHMDRAAALTEGRADWWRQRVRLLWVRTEVALLVGDPAAAGQTAERAVVLAEASRAPRHVAKSLLFLGISPGPRGRDGRGGADLATGSHPRRVPGHAPAALAGPRPARCAARAERAQGGRPGPRLRPQRRPADR